jgi:hypothetical protein
MTRTKRTSLTFGAPFKLAGIDHALLAGTYEIITDEELIEVLSFPVYRRVATWIMASSSAAGATEMVAVDPAALTKAYDLDRKLHPKACHDS